MFSLLIAIIQFFVGIYFAGNMVRQNPKIDSLVSELEGNYGSFNAKLKEAKIIESLLTLKSIYGNITVVLFLLFLILTSILGPNIKLYGFLSTSAFCSIIGWLSIKWCLENKKTIKELGLEILLIVFVPLLLGTLDLLLHTTFIEFIPENGFQFFRALGVEITNETNPIVTGGILSLLLVGLFIFFYVTVWILTLPAAFVSVMFVVLAVQLARWFHKFFPKKPFVGFMMFIGLCTVFYFNWPFER